MMKMKTLRRLSLLAGVLLLPAVASAAVWEVPGDFLTIQAAVDSALVIDGDTIMVGPGSHAGATVSKSVEIKGEGGATITSGPPLLPGFDQGFRLLAGSDGATISHLTFEVVFPIMNGDAVDDVTVTQCTLRSAIQGISDWRGSGWEISHNKILDLRTSCGGGIAILVGDFSGGVVTDNVVSHNKISGTLKVGSATVPDEAGRTECGGYSGTGVVLFADFRFGRSGTASIAFNRVVKNKVSVVSDNPGLVDIVAMELTDTGGNPSLIANNSIGFNDLRGTALQLALSPVALDNPTNNISRNFGANRGHGLHPSLFGPGGN